MDISQTGTPMVTTVLVPAPVNIGVDVVAVVIGLVAVIWIIRLNQKLGGKIKSALWFFLIGVFTNVFAIMWTEIFGHTYSIGLITVDVHDAFMAIGMVFFSLSAYRFSLLVPQDGIHG
jgi:hypothetical protein